MYVQKLQQALTGIVTKIPTIVQKYECHKVIVIVKILIIVEYNS